MQKFLCSSIFLMLFASLSSLASEYDRTDYYGVVSADENGTLIIENEAQTHERTNCAIIVVKNIRPKNGNARLRIAMWDGPDAYAQEGMRPFRASSAKDNLVSNGEMRFKICGLTLNNDYALFAHHDENNNGKVDKNFFGLPTEPYMFSTNKKRDGFGPPKFNDVLVRFTEELQIIEIEL